MLLKIRFCLYGKTALYSSHNNAVPALRAVYNFTGTLAKHLEPHYSKYQDVFEKVLLSLGSVFDENRHHFLEQIATGGIEDFSEFLVSCAQECEFQL